MYNKKHSLLSISIKLIITLLVLGISVIVWLDAYMMNGFKNQQQAKPSLVYARPLELYPGLQLSIEQVVKELEAAAYYSSSNALPGSYLRQGQQLTVQSRTFQFWDAYQDADTFVLNFENNRLSQVNSLKKQRHLRLEPMVIGKIYTGYLEDRELVSLEQAPNHLMGALLATEDRRFFQHYGISLSGIARAFIANIRGGKISEGGSTITQQLVKNLYLSNQRSYIRKLAEIFMALILELRLDKFEILEAYINQVYVAQDGSRAIHGFGLASQYLFNKPIEQLSLADSALLVAMMKGPSYYNPVHHPERALARRNTVLDLMVKENLISHEQAQQAKQQALNISQRQNRNISYPAYLDVVRRQLLRDYSQEQLDTEGLRIFTHMDPHWQWHSQEKISQGVKHHAIEQLDGAAVVINHLTGDILAVVGAAQPRFAGFNRAIHAQRPIGSLVKPAIYLAALERNYTLASLIADKPIDVPLDNGIWRPKNFDHRYHGDVLLIDALAKSYNAASVALGMDVGLDSVIQTLHRLGLEKTVSSHPSLLLGSIEASPLEMAQMYSTIAANGFYTPLKSIRAVSDQNGTSLKRYALSIEQRILAEPQYLLNYALHYVMQQGTGKSVQHRFSQSANIAGKTGTSSGGRDNWFVGYNSQQLAVVWLGADDNRSLPLTGGGAALPIWADIIQLQPDFSRKAIAPKTIKPFSIHAYTGLRSNRRCRYSITIPFVHGTEPKAKSPCTIANSSYN